MTNCLQVPHPEQVRGINIDYNGHGTSAHDVVLTLGVCGSIAVVLSVLIICVYLRYSR